jgi:hypothetical protein
MGTKPSNNFQSDRPESGGADRDSARENSGLLDKNKEQFAADKANERRDDQSLIPKNTTDRNETE